MCCQNKAQTNSLTAPSYSTHVRHQEICHPCYLHHQNQSQEKAHEAYPYGKSSQVYSVIFRAFLLPEHSSKSSILNRVIKLNLDPKNFLKYY